PRGRFISIEGGEGAGKSTQVGMLVAALGRAGIPARATREPGGSPGAEAIRRLLLEGEGERWDAMGEALLLVAARRDHVTRVIAAEKPTRCVLVDASGDPQTVHLAVAAAVEQRLGVALC